MLKRMNFGNIPFLIVLSMLFVPFLSGAAHAQMKYYHVTNSVVVTDPHTRFYCVVVVNYSDGTPAEQSIPEGWTKQFKTTQCLHSLGGYCKLEYYHTTKTITLPGPIVDVCSDTRYEIQSGGNPYKFVKLP